MKEFKTHQSSMLRDGCHPQFVALPGVGGVWGKCFVQPLIYLSDGRYEHTPSYIKGTVSCIRQKKIKNTIVQIEFLCDASNS